MHLGVINAALAENCLMDDLISTVMQIPTMNHFKQEVTHYFDLRGSPPLRKALAKFLTRQLGGMFFWRLVVMWFVVGFRIIHSYHIYSTKLNASSGIGQRTEPRHDDGDQRRRDGHGNARSSAHGARLLVDVTHASLQAAGVQSHHTGSRRQHHSHSFKLQV